MLAHHLEDSDVLVPERAHALALPRRAPAERGVGSVADTRRVDAAVVVLHVDGSSAGPVGGFRDGDRELAVREPDPLEERVAPSESHAAAHEHLGVSAELLRLHRLRWHSRGR